MTFELNGKQYKSKDLDYNAICDLQDMGLDISELANGINFSNIRAIISVLAFNGNVRIAGEEIGNHIISGGTFDEIAQIVVDAIEESGFFQAMSKSTTVETQA